MKKTGKCILVCAGDMGEEEILYKEGDFLIAVDGGLGYLAERNMVPDYILGDFDSLKDEYFSILSAFREKHPGEVTTLPVEKDDTDTVAAARLGLERGYKDFIIYGGLGGRRLDHTLANIQTLVFLKKQGARALLTGQGTDLFVLSGETASFDGDFEGTFSLFALDPEVKGVTIRGMKYPLEDGTLTSSFPLGVSNHISKGQRAGVCVGEGMALAVLIRG